MKILDNINHTVREDLQDTMQKGSRVSIAAACFSIYAYQELKKQLEEIAELRFIFTSPTFVQENTPKERREFYIPKLTREKSLYGTEFEVRLRNELTQKALAKECADWVRRKVKFRSNVSGEQMPGFMTVGESSYMPISGFTTVDLGCERGNNAYYPVQRTETFENGRYFLSLFDEIWNDSSRLQDVTDIVLQSISTAYRENSPDFIYFFTLYNIFSEFLEDVSEDNLPNEATGFKQSKIWNMLYDFQRDAALAIIHKLEQYNGCILADSVGLGKTFTALAVIKYYENRNKSVLVLCPKKLAANWNIYKGNYVNNPLVEDRFRYDVLYHTDLSRSGGTSNGIDLAALNWGNFDLVVIDESHNFRNGSNTSTDEKENRYTKLMNRVIRSGVRTKVLMLSATPVNNRFVDLKNQLALAYEGDAGKINEKLNTSSPIDEIFRQAQKAFNTWSKLPVTERTTNALLAALDFDFFEVLDSVTIARSRRHIEKYYNISDVGTFPERLKPISVQPCLTSLDNAINYQHMDANVLGNDVHNINILTVIASESYDSFAKGLQSELAEAVANRPRKVDAALFVGRVLTDANGNEQIVDADTAAAIYFDLVQNGYVDRHGALTDKYYADHANHAVQVAEEVADCAASVIDLLDSVYSDKVMLPENARSNNVELKIDPDKLAMPEFKALWNKISPKSVYVVDFDTDELVQKSIRSLNRNLNVSKIYFKVESGEMTEIKSKDSLLDGSAFAKADQHKYDPQTKIHASQSVKYDLIGKLVAETTLTRKAIVQILVGIEKAVFDQFKDNPEEFILKAAALINDEKATAIIQHITYNILDEHYDTDIFTEPTLKGQLGTNVMKVQRHLYDHLIYDSSNERDFAADLDTNRDVAVYVKLPDGFYISTPVGKYNPDWAIAFYEGTVKHIYFVAETKGTLDSMKLNHITPVEQAKIDCARAHFKALNDENVVYDVVSDYQTLLNAVMK